MKIVVQRVKKAQVDVEGKTVGKIQKGIALDDLSLEEFRTVSPVFEEDIYEAISMETCVRKRNTAGAPGQEAMKEAIAACKRRLACDIQGVSERLHAGIPAGED